MRRATITIPDELEAELDEFIAGQAAPPSLAAVVQQALRRFLSGEPEAPNDLASLVLSHRHQITELAKSHGFHGVRLFGSVARGEAGPRSDLDFMVEPGPETSLFDLARLRAALIDMLGVDVDVVAAGSMEPGLRSEIHAESLQL